MKEKFIPFKNLSIQSIPNQINTRNYQESTQKGLAKAFSFSLQTFRKNSKILNNHAACPENLEILDCFNNLSLALQDESSSKNVQIMKCKKIFDKYDQESKLPKFSSIQSAQNSINNTLIDDHIMTIQQKKRYQCDDQYSFNGDETERHSLIQKNTDTKSKYQNLIQKIDNFLVKDFAQEEINQLSKHSNKKQSNSKLQLKQKHIENKFQKHRRQKSQKFTRILEQESTVREKLDFLSSYAQALEEQNITLKSELNNQKQCKIRVQILEKQIFEKNIVIDFLTKQLQKKNNHIQVNQKLFEQNKQNKKSHNNIQKQQRNTVSAVNILSKNQNHHPPKYRASHHVESKNSQLNELNFQIYENKQLSQGISGDSYKTKSKSSSFLKKIFRNSHKNKQISSNNKSNVENYKLNKIQDVYIVQILKQENSILSTKLNILYGDFQQIIDKYNQVLTQKNICKAKCCQTIRQGEQHYKNQIDNESYQQNKNNKLTINKQDNSVNQINLILAKLNNHSIEQKRINNCQLNKINNDQNINSYYQKDNQQEGIQLFTEQDFEQLRAYQRQKERYEQKILRQQNYENYSRTDRTMVLRKGIQRVDECNNIKRSLNFGENKNRYSMQQRYYSNQQSDKRFSYMINNNNTINTNNNNTINNTKNNNTINNTKNNNSNYIKQNKLKKQRCDDNENINNKQINRQKIASKQSNRQYKRQKINQLK